MSTLSSPVDAVDTLRAAYPQTFEDLELVGYESCGPDILGRCRGIATLFLELRPETNDVLAWVWDVEAEEFIGPAYEVRGSLDKAASRARELIESTYAEDQLSGTAPRYKHRQLEFGHVV